MKNSAIASFRMNIRRFRRQTHGQIAVLFGLSLVPLVGVTGLAIDYAVSSLERAKLQGAVDGAVLSGILSQESTRIGDAAASFDALAHKNGIAGATRSFATNGDGSFSGTANLAVPTTLMGIVGIHDVPIAVRATAQRAPSTKAMCLISLDPFAKKTFKVTGNGAVIGPSCKLQVNSNDSHAIHITGNGSVTTAENRFVGQTHQNGNGSIQPMSNDVCPVWNDAFAGLTKPTVPASCPPANTNKTVSSGSVTLQPGAFCGGLKVSGSASVTFAPGLYIMKDGELSVSGSATLTGNGVTFFLTGAHTGLKLSGSDAMHFTAMSTGSLKGFVAYLDPASAAGASSDLSGTKLYIEGVVYLPKQDVKMSGQSAGVFPSPFTSIIANTLELTGQATLTLNSNPSATTVPIPSALVSQSPGPPRLTQ